MLFNVHVTLSVTPRADCDTDSLLTHLKSEEFTQSFSRGLADLWTQQVAKDAGYSLERLGIDIDHPQLQLRLSMDN